ncbi:hypothetical protein OH805_07375 [Streptomyces sp. NBC_00879]|uniref:hypothetical protein n=1 Tax=Streptomyces sp. NBC_00879 TaxID=2975855 RepID=UPI003863A7B7|nr:hypothetical protein OH805_07375 [Streptomyces sp. NBC_00879]
MSEAWGAIRPAAADEPMTLELIVPGTQPADPQYLLGDPRMIQIGGDRRTRLHRRADDVDGEQRPDEYRGRPIPETYTWGSRVGGGWMRGLWLFLGPFLLMNLASWMLPQADATERHGRSYVARSYAVMMRLLAAALTVQLVASLAEISMDLMVWQCAAASRSCVEENTWLLFLSPANGSWWARPGPSLALGALLPLFVVVLLARLGQRTWARTEALRPALSGFGPESDEGSAGPALSRPGFWYGRRQVLRLRSAHTTLAISTLSLLLLAALAGPGRKEGSALFTGFEWALIGLVLLAATVAVSEIVRAGRSERYLAAGRSRIAAYAPRLSMCLLVLTFVDAFLTRPGWVATGRLPGIEALLAGLLVGEMALAAGLFACCVPFAARHMHGRVALRGLGGPVVALLACWLATIFWAVLVLVVADILEGGRTPGMGSIAGPLPLIEVAAWGPVLLVLLAVVVAVAVSVHHARRVRHLRFVVEHDYQGEAPDLLRSDEIARAHSSAALTETAPALLAASGGMAALHLGQIAIGATDAFAYSRRFVDALAGLGTWLGPLLYALVFLAGWAAYAWPASRRSVGLLWDISTFWPRAAHPFAPPCLAERAVPDLQWRMLTWLRSTGGRLLLSGHGQGSVLAAAAAFQLAPEYRRHISFLTYGSPLARIYGRYFPAYFGPSQLRMMEGELAIWRNLWRRTDPIGGQIAVDTERSAVDSSPLRDPLAFGRTAKHPLYAPILGHDDYQADPVFAADRALLLARLGPRMPSPRPLD